MLAGLLLQVIFTTAEKLRNNFCQGNLVETKHIHENLHYLYREFI
jgi:hypothetical protein